MYYNVGVERVEDTSDYKLEVMGCEPVYIRCDPRKLKWHVKLYAAYCGSNEEEVEVTPLEVVELVD